MFDAVKLHENRFYYKYIQDFYNGKIANRSGVSYMNHINEGIAILDFLCAPKEAITAYCLHPLFQCEDELKESLSKKNFLALIDKETLVYLMEYRSTANNFLPSTMPLWKACKDKQLSGPSLSPLVIVNWMLLADKIQNYKDFLKYQSHDLLSVENPTMTYNHYNDLSIYFHMWTKTLYSYFQFSKDEINAVWELIDP